MKEHLPVGANSSSDVTPEAASPKKTATSPSRRAFLAQVGGATAATIASAAVAVGTLAPSAAAQQNGAQPNVSSDFGSNAAARVRALKCFNNRVNAAQAELNVRLPNEVTNGDENRFPNRIGNFSKGLVHNSIGEVDGASYNSLLRAVNTGDSRMFDQIIMGGTSLLVGPQSGLAFDLEGADSHALAIGTPPSVASREIADAAVENYWMALCRDVNFTQYGNEPLTQAAIHELNSLQAFHGPKPVTAQNLFRGFTPGDVVGPYISQFLLQPFSYGAIPIEQLFTTYLPSVDYLTDQASWLFVQNGVPPSVGNQIDPNPQHMRNGRGLGAYVHIDVLFEAYFNACLILVDRGAPLDPNHPYTGSRTQAGFGTFGNPHLKTLVAEVSQRALKAVWYMKWFVHRHLRPEEYGGLVHMTKTHQANYPIHADVLNSDALARTFAKYSSYFMPHGFPEGCPQHPSYGQGHGTVAGACSTIVKAWFDDLAPISAVPGMQVFQASEDGFSLVPYTGSDSAQMTIGGEMNKVAANIAIGRNHAAVHWRYDYADSVVLGESVAIAMLRDMAHCWNEPFAGFSLTKFDGTRITGIGKNT
ncbi:MAG: vanadium-dependent haloperoxidase [Candidatus Acidiferrum sp.]